MVSRARNDRRIHQTDAQPAERFNLATGGASQNRPCGVSANGDHSMIRRHSPNACSYSAEIIRIVEIDETAKILVVGHDNVFLTPLQERLQVRGFKRLTDFQTSAKRMICFDSTIDDRDAKERMLIQFATQNSIPVLMGPMVPLSEGKNLQMCNYLFILDCP